MEHIEWIATTPEGQRLGEMAARSVQIVTECRPWWAFPLEPLHWFVGLTGAAPHSFYVAAFYLALATLMAGWTGRRWGWRAGLAWGTTTGMILVGGIQADGWIYTKIPYGTRWQSPPSAPFRLANLHCHSQASGGCLMPEDLLAWHLAKGYSVVAITDSNKIYPGLRAAQIAQERGLPIVVLPGEEYRGTTHLLMFNLKNAIRADQVEIEPAIAQARAQGALVICAHIWTGKHTAQQLFEWGVRGFEVSNGRALADTATQDFCRQKRLATLGTLDFRQGNSPRVATVLPADADTPARVLQALEQGRCATLYVPAWTEPAQFRLTLNLQHRFQDLTEEGGHLLLPGLIFWAVVLRWIYRWVRPTPARTLPAILMLALMSGGLGLWSIWWKFKIGWFPRVELALLVWLLASPTCLYLACCEVSWCRQSRQHAVEVS